MGQLSVSIPLSKIRMGRPALEFSSKGDLLNCYDSCQWILRRYNLIGWTYSFDVEYTGHFKRLICGSGRVDGNVTHVKYAPNIHQKVYVDKKEMLISSANLVAPTIQNVSVVIRDQTLINYMRILFNKQWRYL
jgi:hypothetical protein